MTKFTQTERAVLMATLIAGLIGCGEEEKVVTPPPPQRSLSPSAVRLPALPVAKWCSSSTAATI